MSRRSRSVATVASVADFNDSPFVALLKRENERVARIAMPLSEEENERLQEVEYLASQVPLSEYGDGDVNEEFLKIQLDKALGFKQEGKPDMDAVIKKIEKDLERVDRQKKKAKQEAKQEAEQEEAMQEFTKRQMDKYDDKYAKYYGNYGTG